MATFKMTLQSYVNAYVRYTVVACVVPPMSWAQNALVNVFLITNRSGQSPKTRLCTKICKTGN